MNEREQAGAPVFTKEQLLGSIRYSGVEKDVLRALLPEGAAATHEQAAQLLRQFQSTEVR
jgi:hypothetical protein